MAEKHRMVRVEGAEAVFKCSRCGRSIGFTVDVPPPSDPADFDWLVVKTLGDPCDA